MAVDTSAIIAAADALGQEIAAALDQLDARVAALEGQTDNGDIDLSNYTETFCEDFDREDFFEPEQKNDYGNMSRPWLPHYSAAYGNQYGSSGAIYDECGWMVDPRDPAMAAYNPFSVADSILSITTQPRPAELADLPLNNGGGNPCSWLGGAIITMGTQQSGGFAQQYGYFEIRMKAPPSMAGNFPAFWLLSATNRWPTEIDIYEMFGAGRSNIIQPALHSDPYWPQWKGVDSSMGCIPGGEYRTDNLTEDFHLIGVDAQPDTGITAYYDRKRIATFPPCAGVIDLEITNPGTTVKADGGGASGVLCVKIASSFGAGGKTAVANLTVTDGRVTAVAITAPGSVQVAAAQVVLKNNSDGSLGDAVLTPVVADKDPLLPLQYHTPLYMLANFALGSFTGTPTTPSTFEIDYVKAWRRNIPTPAIIDDLQPETEAICDAANITTSSLAINNLICQLKSWKLRHDTVPMSPHTSDWDVTKLSLWDAMDFLFLAGDTQELSALDWKNPDRSLVHFGNVSYEPLRGYSYKGGVGTYSDTGYTPTGADGIRQDDHHLGVWLGDAVTDPALKAVISAGYKTYLQVSATSHEYRSSVPANAGGVMQKLAPGAGHLVMCRGWRYQHQSFHDGQLFHAGYVATQTPDWASCVVGALSAQYAGPDCRILAAHGGRRLMPDENEKLHQLVGEYFGTLGVRK